MSLLGCLEMQLLNFGRDCAAIDSAARVLLALATVKWVTVKMACP